MAVVGLVWVGTSQPVWMAVIGLCEWQWLALCGLAVVGLVWVAVVSLCGWQWSAWVGYSDRSCVGVSGWPPVGGTSQPVWWQW